MGIADGKDYEEAVEFASHIYKIGQNHPTLSFEPVLQTSKLRPGGWSGRFPAAAALQTPADLDKSGLPPLDDTRWGTLCAVFSAPWFARVWVIREVFASFDEPIVVAYGRCHGFLPLLWAGYFISQNGKLLRQSKHIKTMPACKVSLSHTRLLLQLAIGKLEWTLEGILWRTVAYGATKPVDKYFALVDLTLHQESGTNKRLPLPEAISPNYSRSLAHVGRDYTRHIINESPTLLILSLINHDEESIARCPDEHPSWAYIPSSDLHSTLLGFGHMRTILYTTTGGAYYPSRRGHDAGTYASPCVAPTNHKGTITLQGVKLGHVKAVPPPRPTDNVPTKGKLWLWIEFKFAYNITPCSDIDRFLGDFFATITAREDFGGRDVRPVPDDLYLWVKESRGMDNAGAEPGDPSAPSPSLGAFMDHVRQMVGELPPGQGDSGQMERWMNMYDTGRSSNRQFGILEDGVMVLGPRAMAAEDVVCVLDGGELAHVLRPTGAGEYLFLGECFVYAVAKGCLTWHDWNLRKEWFSLV